MPEISFGQGERYREPVGRRLADPVERRLDRLEAAVEEKLAEQTIVSWRYTDFVLRPSDSWWGGLLYLVGVVLCIWAALHFSNHERLVGTSVEKALNQSREINTMTEDLRAGLDSFIRETSPAALERDVRRQRDAAERAVPVPQTDSSSTMIKKEDISAAISEFDALRRLEKLSERITLLAALNISYPVFILIFGAFLFLLLSVALTIVIQIFSEMTRFLSGGLIAVTRKIEGLGVRAFRYLRLAITGARSLMALVFDILQTAKGPFLFIFLGVPIFDLMSRAQGSDATMAGFYYHAIGLEFTEFLALMVRSVFG